MISSDLEKAAELLRNDEVIGMPTETVYGLAGNIYSENAIRKIYSIKKRPYYNPLIVHIKGKSDLEKVARDIPVKARALADKFWPGPLTLLLKKSNAVPDLITAGKPTVALRIPDHPVALALLRQLDFPLAAPSANPFGCLSPTTAEHVESYFHGIVPLVLQGGASKKGVESTIIGFEGEQAVLYRYGAIDTALIEAVTGPLKIFNREEINPDAPGMLSKHYSPRTPTIVSEDIRASLELYPGKRKGLLLFNDNLAGYDPSLQLVLSNSGDMEEAASHLYSYLHLLDEMGLDLIICEKIKEEGLGLTINDRLQRASVESID